MKIQIELHDYVLCRHTIINSHLLDLEMEGYMQEMLSSYVPKLRLLSLKLKIACKLRDCSFIF